MSSNRDAIIDTARGWGILLVFLSHLFLYDSVPFRVIFNFHMPLFFLLSGMVFKLDGILTWKVLRDKIKKNILVPLLSFSVLGIVVNLIFGTFLPARRELILEWLANITHGGPSFVPSAWFLTCLMLTQATFWVIFSRCPPTRRIIRLLLIVLAALACAHFVTPLSLKVKIICPMVGFSVPLSLAFFAAGFCFRDRLKQPTIWLVPVFFATAWLSTRFKAPNLAIPEVYCIWSFTICSLSGILFVLLVSKYTSCRSLCFIGQNSLIFFMMEGHVVRAVLHVANLFLPGTSKNPLTEPLASWLIPVVFSISLGLIALLCPFINKMLDRIKYLSVHS